MDKNELQSAENETTPQDEVVSTDNTKAGETSLYNPAKDEIKGTIKKFSTKSLLKPKWLAIGGGSALILSLFALLIIFLSTLLVPGLAQNILTYEFARVERQFSQDNDEVISEDAAVKAAEGSASESAAVDSEFSNLSSTDNLLTKIKNLNPNNVFDNLQEEGTIKFNYSASGSLDNISIADQTIAVPDNQFTTKLFHPIQYFQDNVTFADQVSTALQDVMPDNGIGVLIRGGVEQQIMDAIDAPRFAWIASKFNGDNSEQADEEQQLEAADAIEPTEAPAGSIVGAESNTIQRAEQDEANAVSPSQAAATLKNDGVPTDIPALLKSESASLSGVSSNVVGILNPIYKVFLPFCIIYDGSIQNTGDAQQTINNNSNEDQRSFFYVEVAADQQKSGDTNGAAVGALNAKLGNDIGDSDPMLRADGESPATVGANSNNISPQTAGNGMYTAINAFLPQLAFLNPLVAPVCKVVTNPEIAGAGALLAIINAFDGSDETVEGAALTAEPAVDTLVNTAADSESSSVADILDNTATSTSSQSTVLSKLKKLIPTKGDLVQIAGISALDVVVRLDTIVKMGELNNGLSQGNDFANQADAGGNLNANQDMQQQYYGVPLSSTQVAYNNIQDGQYIADEYKSQSLYQRYISPSNPDSLVAKIGLDLYGDLNKSYPSSFIASISKIFNPSSLLSSIYNVLNPTTKALADTVSSNDQSDYGIVQWGYTNQEEDLINSPKTGVSYQPLENDEILSKYPEQVSAIEQTYGPCFAFNGVTPTGITVNDSNITVATLLTTMPSSGPDTGQYYITRNNDGDVTGGLCTEQYLGPNDSSDHNAYDSSNNTYDLVFRWRLQQAYENTVNTLTGIANANSSS